MSVVHSRRDSIIMSSIWRFESLKRFMHRIHNWATSQPNNSNSNNNTADSENNTQSRNISGNSTTRPPEGEEHEITTPTATATTTTTTHNTSKAHSCCYNKSSNGNDACEEHLSEVLVVSMNDTKTTAIKTTTQQITADTSTSKVVIKANTNTADTKNSCANVMTTNEATISEQSNNAIAPIAREEDDTEVVWSSAGEEEEEEEELGAGKDMEVVGKQLKLCCYSMNYNEQQCYQGDAQMYDKSTATTNTSTLAVTVTLKSTMAAPTAEADKSVQRSTSRMRTYLKRCKDRLTGHHQQTTTNTTFVEPINTHGMPPLGAITTTVAMHMKDERSKESSATNIEVLKAANETKRNVSQNNVEEEKKEEEFHKEWEEEENEEKEACTTALIAVTSMQQNNNQHATQKLLATLTENVEGEERSAEEGEDEEETDGTLTELVYEDIDFSLPSTLMDNSSGSNVSVDQQQTTPLTFAADKQDDDGGYGKEGTLTLTNSRGVDDSGDLLVECDETVKQQQQQQQQQQHIQNEPLLNNFNSCLPLVKEEQLACAIRLDSSTAALIDKHLAAIYPVYAACTRAILIRQARDLLVCSYFGCLESFEMQFLCKFAEIAAELRQRHAIGENILWNKGWPLTTPTGEVILHLGALENALVRPGDVYLCVKSVNKTEVPQLYVVWRNASSGIPHQPQQQLEKYLPHASAVKNSIATEGATKIQSYCIDLNNATSYPAIATTTAKATNTIPPTTTYLSILTLEMLTSDELPQLLQNLLVGVEHSIERVSLNELQMPASMPTMAAAHTTKTSSTSAVMADEKSSNNNSSSGMRNNSISYNNSYATTITNSPKCALRRSELITKNKVLNNKFMLRRLTNRQDSMNSTSSGQSCGSSGSTSSDELLRCTTTNQYMNITNNMVLSNNDALLESVKMSPGGSTNSASTSPALPLFCLGNSFPHIDSDEENADEKRSSLNREDQYECEIVPPASINEIPEKLLTASGIYLPGTRDLKGHPIVTVDAECVLAAGVNCYEIATVLLYYSTISERISTVNVNDQTKQQQQQQQQNNRQHSQQSSISSPSTPKMVDAATATTTAMTATTTTPAASAATAPSTSIQLTSNVTTATTVKSPAHTHKTVEVSATVTAKGTNTNKSNTNSSMGNSTSNNNNAAMTTFNILIAIEKSSQMCVIDLICQSLRLLTRQIAYCEILAVCLESNLLQQMQQQQQNIVTFNNTVVSNSNSVENNESKKEPQEQQQQQQQYTLKFISVNEVTTSVAPSQIPYGKLQGLHHHDARKWREFFIALDPFQQQCALAAQRLVAAMSDIRSADLQGLPTRRQLYAQHRALSRALMDSELHNLRKRGTLKLAHLQELAKSYAAPPPPPSTTATTTTIMETNGLRSDNHNGNINANNSSTNNNNSNRYYYSSSISNNSNNNNNNNSSNSNNRYSSSGNKLLSTISSISHLGFGGSYSFSMHHSQQQQQQQTQQQQHNQNTMSQNRPIVSKYNAMTSPCAVIIDTTSTTTMVGTATQADATEGGVGSATEMNDNIDVAIRLHKVTLLFNEVDRAAKRLEQLTEQRREQLRELTRQRALEDEINEVTSWITSDGNDTLQRYATLQLDCETAIKEQEQEFEKYYFISMKHLAKGRDLHDAAINIEALHESAVNLKSALDCFADKLEMARERIEAASRLQHLLSAHKLETNIQQEMQRLAEIAGATVLLEKYRQKQNADVTSSNIEVKEQLETNENTNQTGSQIGSSTSNKPNSLNLSLNLNNSYRSSYLSKQQQQQQQQQVQHVGVITSTPVPRMNRLSHRSSSGIGSFDGQTCQCWRESRNMEDMDELLDADGEELEMDADGEEEQSKIADSGVGGCERCEGNPKLTRVCSCQSLNEASNLYGKSDELDFECFERPVKRYADIHSPMEANAHLQYHASSLELSKLEELSCLDPKIQKTLLLIMREMIGTERDYVHSLNYVIENYVDELLREDIPQPLRGQRNVIFGNIEKIFEFHKWHFLNKLERYERNPLKIGSAFLEMESKFYLYALYNKNKPKSDTLMSEYGTAFFKSKQFELNDKMDLASYLLKPVQRMGKYALLLQQLVKACNAVEGAALQEIAADVEELQRAEEMVKFQLRHGNDLLAMDSLRDCDVNVKEQGRLLRQNEFLVWQGRGGKKSLRQIFLFEDLVLFSKARRFPDQKNLDIYIYKNSIKTSDIGLTAHVGDSKTKFEIWFRKRKPDDTWTMQCMSEDIKNAWTEEISKLLWKQANRNREIRLAEMSSMGIGSKPCLDIRPSHNQINDRSITISQLAPKLRHSFAGMHLDGTKSTRRPNSLISESSLSSGTSSSSLSTGSSSGGHERVVGSSNSAACNSKLSSGTLNSHHHHHALELINETQTLMLSSGIGGTANESGASCANTNTLSSSGSSGGRSGHSSSGSSSSNRGKGGTMNGAHCNASNTSGSTGTRTKRSTTLVSQLSMESGILSDISMTPDQEQSDATSSWLNSATTTTTTTPTTKTSPSAISTTATIGDDSMVILRRHRLHHHHQQHTKQYEEQQKHKELQQQQSAPAALQERINSMNSNQINPYLKEFKADSINL